MNSDLTIATDRLILHTVLGPECALLDESYSHQQLWLDRGFSDPIKYFENNKHPIKYRITQVLENPDSAKYLLRVAVLKKDPIIIATAGFHSLPNENGMIEIGLGIEPAFQGKGYAKESLQAMWRWAVGFPEVKTLRYTVSPDNLPSIAVINFFGFELKGQQMDEIDGPEDIYEMSAKNFSKRWGSNER